MTLASPSSPSPASFSHHRFTAEQYHRMIESSVFAEDDRVELIDGEIVDMSPIGKEHSGVVDQLVAFLRVTDAAKTIIRVQSPILMNDHSEPEPDVTVLKFRSDFYRKSLPTPDDVLLLIDVADASLDTDRRVKMPLYARAGITEAWVVDLHGKAIEVFRGPVNGRYTSTKIFETPEAIAPLAFPNHAVRLDELFPG